jgi:signal transduction histidine kinase
LPELRKLRLASPGPRAELALAIAFVGATLVEQLARSDTDHSPLALAWTLAVAATVLVRRTHPVAGTWVAALLLAAVPQTVGDAPASSFEFLLPIILSYACGAHAPTRPGLAATVALTAAIQVHVGFSEFPNLEIALGTLPPWWVGMQVRRRRQLVRELSARTRELEAEEEAFVRLSVHRERARIARDLHDIVSHHLAVMVIQAGAGRLAEPWQPDVAGERFATIRQAGDQALAEADRLVTMLQADGETPRLAQLLERAQASGARVVVAPAELALAPEIEAIAYRVAQEALTNAMKHAPGATVDVDVALVGGELTIIVHNDAVTEASPIADTGSGLGLAGMRERLAALDGSLTAGPDLDGGFRLCARLPADGLGASLPLST